MANDSTTVNGTTCALGESCTVTGAPSGSAGGDLSGSYPDPDVDNLSHVTNASLSLMSGVTGTLPVGNGGTGTSTAFTQGSVVFAGSGGVYTQDNANLNWNDSTDVLSIPNLTATTALLTSGYAAITGTSLPTQAAGTLGLGGSSSTPTLGANGEGDVYLSSTNGLTLIGRGSTNDLAFLNKNGSTACYLTTGTSELFCGFVSSNSIYATGSTTGLAVGTVFMTGEVSAPTFNGNGEGGVFLPSTTGGVAIAGQGSTDDIEGYNKNGTLVYHVPTGTTGFNVAGTVTGASAVLGSPTGGNEGAGTLNATGLYVNGTPVAPTSGSSILSGNGSGGFSSVTVGTGLSFSGGTLSATASAPAFNSITSGTNTAASMVVGSGASLGVSGSGTITATAAPLSGITGFGTGVATALGDAVNSTGGFGTVGTSGSNVGLLNANKTDSGTNTFSGTENITGTFEVGGNAMTFPGSAVTLAGLGIAESWTAGQSGGQYTPSISTSTFTPDLNQGNHFIIQLVHASCPCTIAAPANLSSRVGSTGVIEIIQSSTGSDTVSWNADYKFGGGTAPTLSTGASDVDEFGYYVRDSSHVDVGTFGLNFH